MCILFFPRRFSNILYKHTKKEDVDVIRGCQSDLFVSSANGLSMSMVAAVVGFFFSPLTPLDTLF